MVAEKEQGEEELRQFRERGNRGPLSPAAIEEWKREKGLERKRGLPLRHHLGKDE